MRLNAVQPLLNNIFVRQQLFLLFNLKKFSFILYGSVIQILALLNLHGAVKRKLYYLMILNYFLSDLLSNKPIPITHRERQQFNFLLKHELTVKLDGKCFKHTGNLIFLLLNTLTLQ